MQVFIKTSTDDPTWYVFCHNPSFYLGPYPTQMAADEIRQALTDAYEFGKTEIQEGIRELLGLTNVGN